jgi:glucokinase
MEGGVVMERFAGCVDIGGTKILAGISDSSGQVLAAKECPTPLGEGAALRGTEKMVEIMRDCCRETSVSFEQLAGIGIVCAGPVDATRGIVKNPYTLLGWDDFPLTEHLERQTGLRAVLDHDVNGALYGEIFIRGLEGSGKRVLMLAFGTGIGVSLYDRDHMFTCSGVFHPEMGHVIAGTGTEMCYCGRTGCFEILWSGSAINRRAQEIGYSDFDSLFEVRNRDDKAKSFLDAASRELLNGLWNLMVVFKPDVLILGGGLMKRYFQFTRDLILNDFGKHPDFIETLCVELASEKTNSALIGAARIAFNL